MGRPITALAVVALVVLRATPGIAQTAPDSAEAHFNRGLSLADQGRWDDAIEAFERARAIAALPAVLFNLAEAHRRAGHLSMALSAYGLYLGRASASSQFRTVARQHVAALERRVARLRLDVTPPAATVRIDDRDLPGDTRELALDPGPHAVVLRAPGYEPEARTMTLSQGERATLAVHLARASAPPPTTGAAASMAPSTTPATPTGTPATPTPTPTPDTTYRNAFQIAGVTHAILDDGSIGFGAGVRVGMRLARSWEILAGFNSERSNGVGYVTAGFGFFYVSHAASPIAVYMGAQLGVLVPQCTTSCTYESGTPAQTDMALTVTAGARFEFLPWLAPFIELNGGVARFTDPIPLIYFGSGIQLSVPM